MQDAAYATSTSNSKVYDVGKHSTSILFYKLQTWRQLWEERSFMRSLLKNRRNYWALLPIQGSAKWNTLDHEKVRFVILQDHW